MMEGSQVKHKGGGGLLLSMAYMGGNVYVCEGCQGCTAGRTGTAAAQSAGN